MAVKRWEVDEAAVTKMLQEPSVASHLLKVAQAGLDKARTAAPSHTGRYRDSLRLTDPRVEDDVLKVGFGSDHWTWHFVEYGSVNNSPHRTLAQAASAVADRVELL